MDEISKTLKFFKVLIVLCETFSVAATALVLVCGFSVT
jgi:hypothetical protein